QDRAKPRLASVDHTHRTISGSKKPVGGVQQDSVPGNFLQSLVAVLVGNGLYFALMPHLPVLAQHHMKRLDWGLVWTSGCAWSSTVFWRLPSAGEPVTAIPPPSNLSNMSRASPSRYNSPKHAKNCRPVRCEPGGAVHLRPG